MKKKAILAGIAAIMGVSGFYGYSAATAGSGLSGRGMENASILSDPEVYVKYATCCKHWDDHVCCMSYCCTIWESEDCDDPEPGTEEDQP